MLKNLINKDVVTPQIQESLLSAEHLVQEQMRIFVDKHMCEPPDSAHHLNLKAPIQKNKVKTFYTSVIQIIFAFCILVYYGNASSRDIHKVHRIIKQAQKLTQCQCQSIHEIYNIVCTRKVRLIVGDDAHPLHQFYSKLRSGIRFKSTRGRTKRYLTSFVPASITHFNSLCRR